MGAIIWGILVFGLISSFIKQRIWENKNGRAMEYSDYYRQTYEAAAKSRRRSR